VWATVFKDNIAESGLSIFVFNSRNDLAQRLPFFSCDIKNEGGTERSTDSVTEQRNETNNARNRYANRAVIFSRCPVLEFDYSYTKIGVAELLGLSLYVTIS
jgi:hypothetical protein